MEIKASKVASALDFLQQLALNPLTPVPTKHRSILDEVKKSYCSNVKGSKSGKKRKQPPSKSAPKPKRQRTGKGRYKRSEKEENDDDDQAITESFDREEAVLIEDSAIDRGIRGDSPSHFTYFHEDEGVFIADKDALSPLWKRGDPRHNDLDQYLQSVAKIFYHPIEAMDRHLTIEHRNKSHLNNPLNDTNNNSNSNFNANSGSNSNSNSNLNANSLSTTTSTSIAPEKKLKRGRGRPKGSKNKKTLKLEANPISNQTEEKMFRYSTINLILSPLRKRSPIDEWNPREVALFESAMCCKGKQFYEISKMIGTKNTKQCVEFYYHWKQSSNYAVWKALGRKTNKKATSSSQRKLHKKIGQKFAEFHAKYSKSSSSTHHHLNANGGGGGGPMNSIQNGLNQCHLTVNHDNNHNPNANDGTKSNGGNLHSLYEQQLHSQQQQQLHSQPIVTGYYPQYYAQNGYSWYQPPHGINAYAQYPQQPQQQSQQQQLSRQTMSNGQSNSTLRNKAGTNGSGNGGTTSTVNAGDKNGDKAMCIDLTESSSVNGNVDAASTGQQGVASKPAEQGKQMTDNTNSNTSTSAVVTVPQYNEATRKSDNAAGVGAVAGATKESDKENVNELVQNQVNQERT